MNRAEKISGTFDPDAIKRVRFGDFPIVIASRNDLVEWALRDCENSSQPAKLVFDANGHALSLARTDAHYREAVKQADIVHADGGFLVTLSRVLRLGEIPERSATTDMLHDFAQGFQEHAHGFYLLGGEESVNSSCVSILKRDYKRLNIAGRRHGYFASEDEQTVVDDINKSGASILWVGLGKPREQEFCIKWRDALKVKWIITCGGCFNYVTGDYPRAPQWMQRLNLEWLHRMSTRPRALFYRYAITTPHALLIAVTDNGKAQ